MSYIVAVTRLICDYYYTFILGIALLNVVMRLQLRLEWLNKITRLDD